MKNKDPNPTDTPATNQIDQIGKPLREAINTPPPWNAEQMTKPSSAAPSLLGERATPGMAPISGRMNAISIATEK